MAKWERLWVTCSGSTQTPLYCPEIPGHRLPWWLRQSLGWEDPLEEGMTTHSSILPWRILWTEDPGGLESMGMQRVGHNLNDSAQHSALSWSQPGQSTLVPGAPHCSSPTPELCVVLRSVFLSFVIHAKDVYCLPPHFLLLYWFFFLPYSSSLFPSNHNRNCDHNRNHNRNRKRPLL